MIYNKKSTYNLPYMYFLTKCGGKNHRFLLSNSFFFENLVLGLPRYEM